MLTNCDVCLVSEQDRLLPESSVVLRNCDVRFVSGHEFTRAEESL